MCAGLIEIYFHGFIEVSFYFLLVAYSITIVSSLKRIKGLNDNENMRFFIFGLLNSLNFGNLKGDYFK